MKSISFLLTSAGTHPAGGYKVVYEYANRFVADGYDVNILYPACFNFRSLPFKKKIRAVLKYFYWAMKGYGCRSWFNLDHRVKEFWVRSLDWHNVPKTDCYVATAARTSYALNDYPVDRTKKFYLIQGFENWGVSEDYVYKSYMLGLKNIVISNWLAERVKSCGAKFHLLKNGFDFDYFKLSTPIEKKDPFQISMLYNNEERKGCVYGIEALKKVREHYPQVRACFFGVPKRPANLPDWIEYYQAPDRDTHNMIYNRSSIYLAPSLQEGWGLTVGEAMICGNAIVCTDTLGFSEMITDGKNGFIVPIRDSQALADRISILLEDDDLRQSFAHDAVSTITYFTWENSYNTFKDLIDHI